MSLIIEDPQKYKELRDEFQKIDEATLANTVALIKNSSDADISSFLDSLGRFLHNIRVNNKMTLRSFCKKYELSPVIIGEIERGLRLPNLELLDIYLRDDIKEKHDDSKLAEPKKAD